MEPKQPAPNIGPESAPINYERNLERTPVPISPEVSVEKNAERFEQRSESTSPPIIAAPVLPTPVVVVPADDTTNVVSDDGTPAIAKDDDLIEKEWVDKAKKIIVQTKDDPFRREQEVEKLQADYLRKRYGRELGAPQ